jgi:hypothetical protein
MAWWIWTLSIYLTVAVVIAIRLLFVLSGILKELKNRGIRLNLIPFIRTAFADSLAWPYYVIRYGINAFIKDIW